MHGFARTALILTLSGALSVGFAAVASAHPHPVVEKEDGSAALAEVYAGRPDLQAVFEGEARTGSKAMRAAGMVTLEDWARRYGYKEYAEALSAFAPLPPALSPVPGTKPPRLKDGADFDFDAISATSVFVVDAASHEILLSYNASAPHPLASISKLVTAMVVLDRKTPLAKRMSIIQSDEVGGARLNVAKGDWLSVLELLNVTLVASANNAANALARSTGLARPAFVAAMNEKATALGLVHTTFADPTGIEVENVSTAKEIAAIGMEAFSRDAIRRATTTSRYPLQLARRTHTLKNTNEILNDPDNGIYVMGGKTGYLEESKWNLVVKMRNARSKPILVVTLGSGTKAQSFADAEKVGKWVWQNYEWGVK